MVPTDRRTQDNQTVEIKTCPSADLLPWSLSLFMKSTVVLLHVLMLFSGALTQW
jgi:hypothetical protein